MLADGSATGGARRQPSVDSLLGSAVSSSPSSSSSSGPLRALLSYRLSDLLFLSLGCCALLLSLGREGEWRLQLHAAIPHSIALSAASLSSLVPPATSESVLVATSSLPLPQPVVADLDGDRRNGQRLSHDLRISSSVIGLARRRALCPTLLSSARAVSPSLWWRCVSCQS